MKAIIRRVAAGRGDLALDEIDISNDPVLMDRYGLEIPVLELDGRKIAKYRITEADLTRILDRVA
jgi:hypothetical protein